MKRIFILFTLLFIFYIIGCDSGGLRPTFNQSGSSSNNINFQPTFSIPPEADNTQSASPNALPAPVINNITPSSGGKNASVTINGRYFGTEGGKVLLTLNNGSTSASIASWNANNITFTIPSSIKVGTYQITVKRNGTKSKNSISFVVTNEILPSPTPSSNGSATPSPEISGSPEVTPSPGSTPSPGQTPTSTPSGPNNPPSVTGITTNPALDINNKVTLTGYGTPVQLTANNAVDPDGNTLTYKWSYREKDTETYNNITEFGNYSTYYWISPINTALEVIYEVQLEVSDGTSTAVTEPIEVLVKGGNSSGIFEVNF